MAVSLVLGPAFAIFFDSAIGAVLMSLFMSLYLHFWVVPTEERLLSTLFGAEFEDFSKNIPKYWKFLHFWVAFGVVYAGYNLSLFIVHWEALWKRGGRTKFEHFYFTLFYGHFYLNYSVKRDIEWREGDQRRKLRSYSKEKEGSKRRT